jgi:ABC-type amino acid transport system permease subunit
MDFYNYVHNYFNELHNVILILYMFYTSTYIANIMRHSLQGVLMQDKGRCKFHEMLPL